MKIQSFNFDYSEIPRFFRIGTVPTTPWAYYKLDSRGMVMKDKEGRPKPHGAMARMTQNRRDQKKVTYYRVQNDQGKILAPKFFSPPRASHTIKS